jgi:hypothetical protein
VAEFSGGTVSSDWGALPLQEADSKMNLLARFSKWPCIAAGAMMLALRRSLSLPEDRRKPSR